MGKKQLNLLLILTSLVGYLEWGRDQSMFLFQMEAELFARALHEPGSVLHPFTVLPVLGQLTLLWTVFQRTPSRMLTYAGIAGLGLLLVLMFVIGLLTRNMKILVSTIPFLVVAVITIRAHRATREGIK
jgi:hypothetical protein